MALSDLLQQPPGTGFTEINEQRLVELQIHALDCDKGVTECFECWELQKQSEIDFPNTATT